MTQAEGGRRVTHRGGGVSATCMAESGGSVAYVTENWGPPEMERLSAVVIWNAPAPPTRRWSHPMTPEEIEAFFAEASAVADARLARWRAEPSEWSTGGADGQEIGFHRDRRVLRLLGVEYALPEGDRGLAVLVDASDPTVPAEVRVIEIASPPYARAPIDPGDDVGAAMQRRHEAAMECQHAVLYADAEVRAFLERAGFTPQE